MTQTATDDTLSRLLRRTLADRRLSGRALARLAGINPATVARILRGDRDATVTELGAIARALDVTPGDLIPASAA